MPFQRVRSRFVAGVLAAGAALVFVFARPEAQSPVGGDVRQIPAQRLSVERANAFVEAERRGLNYLPGEVIVRFKPGMAPDRQQRALMALRSRPDVSELEWHDGFAVLRDRLQPDAHILAEQLSEQPEVEYAEPNYIARTSPFEPVVATGRAAPAPRLGGWINRAPNDPDYVAYQWNMTLLAMPRAWDIQDGANPDIIVAVVDTGITVSAQTFTFPLWTGSTFQQVQMQAAVNGDLPADRLVAPRDFVFPQTDGVVDMDGHGTHVSGTIAEGTNNSALLAGMAYNARIMPVKVCTGYWEVMIARAQAGISGFVSPDAGGCPFSEIASGVRYAVENGARVINISLGGGGQSTTAREALTYATARGAFIAISMGNDFESGNRISYPAGYAQDIEGAMAVAAVGKAADRSFYSSTGPHCEIAAPGGDSRVGGGSDRGFIWQSTLVPGDSFPFVLTPRFDRYDKVGFMGTSMASPHVAGLAALIMAQSPGVSPASVERIIRATAKDLGAPGKDDSFGYGLIQPRAALFGRGIAK